MKLKIPKNITLFYNNKFLVLKNSYEIKFLKIKTLFRISTEKKYIKFLNKKSEHIKIFNFRSIILYNKTLVIIIKEIIKMLKNRSKKKLKLIGIGFRIEIKKFSEHLNILIFKLGYSHSINIVVSKKVSIRCSRKNKILISAHNSVTVNKISSLIRSYKYPDPYKGKGVLYENEVLKLKEGKKV